MFNHGWFLFNHYQKVSETLLASHSISKPPTSNCDVPSTAPNKTHTAPAPNAPWNATWQTPTCASAPPGAAPAPQPAQPMFDISTEETRPALTDVHWLFDVDWCWLHQELISARNFGRLCENSNVMEKRAVQRSLDVEIYIYVEWHGSTPAQTPSFRLFPWHRSSSAARACCGSTRNSWLCMDDKQNSACRIKTHADMFGTKLCTPLVSCCIHHVSPDIPWCCTGLTFGSFGHQSQTCSPPLPYPANPLSVWKSAALTRISDRYIRYIWKLGKCKWSEGTHTHTMV